MKYAKIHTFGPIPCNFHGWKLWVHEGINTTQMKFVSKEGKFYG